MQKSLFDNARNDAVTVERGEYNNVAKCTFIYVL